MFRMPGARRLVGAEVVGDRVHLRDPKDEQRDGGPADECARNQDKAPDSAGREVSRATWQPPGRSYAGSDVVTIRVDTTPPTGRTSTFAPNRGLANGRRSAMMKAWKDVRTNASFTGRFFAARTGFVRPLPSRYDGPARRVRS